MATLKLVLNKNWKHKDGTYPLVFQVIHNRKKRIIYTGYKICESNFDSQTQKVLAGLEGKLSVRAVMAINRDLGRRRKLLQVKINLLENRGDVYTAWDINENPVVQHDFYLLQYMDYQIGFLRKSFREGMAQALQSTRNSLGRFLNNRDIQASELTPLFLRHYEAFLIAGDASANTISFYMRNLKLVYNAMIKEGFESFSPSPFKTIRTTVGKTPKRAISREDLMRIAGLEFSSETERHLAFARDLFMFSFYCRGMSFVDIIYLKKSSISGDTIYYSRRKSKQTIRIQVLPQLRELLDKYPSDSDYQLPVLDTNSSLSLYRQYRVALERTNYALKKVGERAGLDFPLTTYIARHTWATLAKELGAPVAVISEGLGHTSEKTTRIYLKEFDTSVIDKVSADVAKLL